jgi:hypothetical protein
LLIFISPSCLKFYYNKTKRGQSKILTKKMEFGGSRETKKDQKYPHGTTERRKSAGIDEP